MNANGSGNGNGNANAHTNADTTTTTIRCQHLQFMKRRCVQGCTPTNPSNIDNTQV